MLSLGVSHLYEFESSESEKKTELDSSKTLTGFNGFTMIFPFKLVLVRAVLEFIPERGDFKALWNSRHPVFVIQGYG